MHGLIRFIIFLDKIHKITSSQDLFVFYFILFAGFCLFSHLFVFCCSGNILWVSLSLSCTHTHTLPVLTTATVNGQDSRTSQFQDQSSYSTTSEQDRQDWDLCRHDFLCGPESARRRPHPRQTVLQIGLCMSLLNFHFSGSKSRSCTTSF